MLRSNLAPSSSHQLDPTRHTYHGVIILTPLWLLIIVSWPETVKNISRAQVLPILEVPGHSTYPVVAFRALLLTSPPLISPSSQSPRGRKHIVVTTVTLSQALKVLMDALQLDSAIYSLQSLKRSGATTAYRAGMTNSTSSIMACGHVTCLGLL